MKAIGYFYPSNCMDSSFPFDSGYWSVEQFFKDLEKHDRYNIIVKETTWYDENPENPKWKNDYGEMIPKSGRNFP